MVRNHRPPVGQLLASVARPICEKVSAASKSLEFHRSRIFQAARGGKEARRQGETRDFDYIGIRCKWAERRARVSQCQTHIGGGTSAEVMVAREGCLSQGHRGTGTRAASAAAIEINASRDLSNGSDVNSRVTTTTTTTTTNRIDFNSRFNSPFRHFEIEREDLSRGSRDDLSIRVNC